MQPKIVGEKSRFLKTVLISLLTRLVRICRYAENYRHTNVLSITQMFKGCLHICLRKTTIK